MAQHPDNPMTKGQLTQLTNLAKKWGRPTPRTDLTYGEAQDAIRWLRNYKRMQEPEVISPDGDLQPGMTLRSWHPYRRTGAVA